MKTFSVEELQTLLAEDALKIQSLETNLSTARLEVDRLTAENRDLSVKYDLAKTEIVKVEASVSRRAAESATIMMAQVGQTPPIRDLMPAEEREKRAAAQPKSSSFQKVMDAFRCNQT